MDNDEQVIDETLEVETEVDEVEAEEESIEDIKARLAKAEELANNYKVRAEKAEKKGDKAPKADTTGLSTKDILALSKANIDDEDLDEVLDYASYKKLPIHEALKSSILKATLAEKAELRKSAQAVNTGATRRASGQVSDERILADARKGALPESDEDIARLARMRLQKK